MAGAHRPLFHSRHDAAHRAREGPPADDFAPIAVATIRAARLLRLAIAPPLIQTVETAVSDVRSVRNVVLIRPGDLLHHRYSR
jgi:hypothetical protein